MPMLDVEGAQLYFETAGEGTRPVVLVHAYPMNRTIWAPQVAALSARYRVITYDVRGFGRSSAPESPDAYSQDRSVRDLLGLLDALHVEKAVVCGLSMGGNIALNFALAHPDRVHGLVPADTGAGSDDPRAFARTVNGWADLAETEGIEGFARAITANPIFAEYAERSPETRRYMWETITGNSVHGVANTARRVLATRPPIYALEAGLRSLACPSLVILGENDHACVPPGLFMARTMPDARLVTISGAGHFNNLEEPEEFNRCLLEFLNDLLGE